MNNLDNLPPADQKPLPLGVDQSPIMRSSHAMPLLGEHHFLQICMRQQISMRPLGHLVENWLFSQKTLSVLSLFNILLELCRSCLSFIQDLSFTLICVSGAVLAGLLLLLLLLLLSWRGRSGADGGWSVTGIWRAAHSHPDHPPTIPELRNVKKNHGSNLSIKILPQYSIFYTDVSIYPPYL